MYDSVAGKTDVVAASDTDRNCEFAGTTSAVAAFRGHAYSWNATTSVGTWSSWVN